MIPLSRTELDEMTCNHSDHNPEECDNSGGLYFHSNCHPGTGCELRYENGILELRCQECRSPIVKLAIAP